MSVRPEYVRVPHVWGLDTDRVRFRRPVAKPGSWVASAEPRWGGRGHRHSVFTDSQIRNALRLVEGEKPATEVARDLGMSRATLYRRIRELPQVTTI